MRSAAGHCEPALRSRPGAAHLRLSSGEAPGVVLLRTSIGVPADQPDTGSTALDGPTGKRFVRYRSTPARPALTGLQRCRVEEAPFVDPGGRPMTEPIDPRLLRLAVAASHDGVVIADARQQDQPLIYVNPAFERLTGYRSDETLAATVASFRGTSATSPASRCCGRRSGLRSRASSRSGIPARTAPVLERAEHLAGPRRLRHGDPLHRHPEGHHPAGDAETELERKKGSWRRPIASSPSWPSATVSRRLQPPPFRSRAGT